MFAWYLVRHAGRLQLVAEWVCRLKLHTIVISRNVLYVNSSPILALIELFSIRLRTPERAFTRASTLGVSFVPKKVPKAPILRLKTLYVPYMKYLRSCFAFEEYSPFWTQVSSRFSRSVFTNTFKNGFLFGGRRRDSPNLLKSAG